MALNKNVMGEGVGTRRAGGDEPGVAPPARRASGVSTGAAAASGLVFSPQVMATMMNPQASAPAAPPVASTAAAGPAVSAFNTMTLDPRVFQLTPGIFLAAEKTTTQIAQAAINQLTAATPAVVREAINTAKAKNVSAAQLMNYLERKTRVGEVLNQVAQNWSNQTVQDFGEAFQMAASTEKLPVMDSIVSISILNDPDLRDELEDENTTEASSADLLENRRIVWQWPEPGTPFTPPYILMVAVERHDTTQAQNVIQTILGDLVDVDGYKIPRAAAQKLSGTVGPGRPPVLSVGPATTLLKRQ